MVGVVIRPLLSQVDALCGWIELEPCSPTASDMSSSSTKNNCGSILRTAASFSKVSTVR